MYESLARINAVMALGWKVHPCRSRPDGEKEAKAPRLSGWQQEATTDPAKVQAWAERWPGCAWGLAATDDVGVLDVDPRNGGHETLARLIAEHGPLPSTPKAKTGGGGEHYYFRFPAGTGCKESLLPGIDIKANGGNVILPPSRIDCPEHEGRAYTWAVSPLHVPVADAPAWLVELCRKPKPIPNASPSPAATRPLTHSASASASPWIVQGEPPLASHPGVEEGQRRKTLVRLVGSAIASGISADDIMVQAEAWAGRCSPPFGDWHKHVVGLLRKDHGSQPPSPTASEEELSGVASGVAKKPDNSPDAQAETVIGLSGYLAGNSEPPSNSADELSGYLADDAEGGGGCNPDGLTLHPDAYHGLLGQMLRAVEPETEADPAGVLLTWLTLLGNAVGRGAWVDVGPRRHHPSLYAGIIGNTSDAKGDTWAVGVWPFRNADPLWAAKCIANGVGSGEGLIERVADEQRYMENSKTGEPKEAVIPGADDKRCLLRLSELSALFKKGRREGSSLSEVMREAWDGEPLSLPNRKANALNSTGYTVSTVGDITPAVITRLLEQGTEAVDGFANRFLWCAVRSSKDLPHGGDITILEPFAQRLGDAIRFGQQAGRLRRDADAESLWATVYGGLKASGDAVPHTDRARPYVVRLSMLYAIADRSAVIRREHLAAALAVWAYCRNSAARAFGSSPDAAADPEPLWLRLLSAIQAEPGVKRSALTMRFKHLASADAIASSLDGLRLKGLAYCRVIQNPNGGPKAEAWYPGGDGGGSQPETLEAHNPLPPSQSAWVVQPDGPPSNQVTKQLPLTPKPGGSESPPSNQVTPNPEPGELSGYLAKPNNPPSNPERGELSGYLAADAEAPKPQAAPPSAVGGGGCKPVTEHSPVILPTFMFFTEEEKQLAVENTLFILHPRSDITERDRAFAVGYVEAQAEREKIEREAWANAEWLTPEQFTAGLEECVT